jgi:hypothetical protein
MGGAAAPVVARLRRAVLRRGLPARWTQRRVAGVGSDRAVPAAVASITPRLPKYWRALGENPADSPNGLKLIAARKIGVTVRPSSVVPNAPERPTLDSRLKKVSLPLRPTAPFSTRTYDSSLNTARRPPPRSSVPRKPRKLLCRPPLSSCWVVSPPTGLTLDAETSIRP